MNGRDLSLDVPEPELPVPACEIRCIVETAEDAASHGRGYVVDDLALSPECIRSAAAIVVPLRGAGRAAVLLAAGARRVLLGEAALRDSSLVSTLATEFGEGSIGVYAPARRLEVRWSFDTVSNADFKVLTPSLGAPAWEVLSADGEGTGTHALWWIGEMLELGAAEALLRVDIRDDADLNLCADCVERYGRRLWIGPLADEAPAIADWIALGQARQLALPPALLAAHSQATSSDAIRPAEATG